MSAIKWTQSIPTYAAGSAGVPALDEDYVAVVLGADFTQSGDSNTGHCRRMMESFEGTIESGPPIPNGMVYSGITGVLSGGTVQLEFDTGVMNANVDWGDGSTPDNVTAGGQITHDYAAGGGARFVVTITGTITRVSNWEGNGLNTATEITFLSWGNGFLTMESCSRLFSAVFFLNDGYAPNDAPDFSALTAFALDNMFNNGNYLVLSRNQDFTGWNMTPITDLSSMFTVAGGGNGWMDFTGWDTSNVTTMRELFSAELGEGEYIGLRGLDAWNVSASTTFVNAFRGVTLQEPLVLPWQMTVVTDIGSMFRDATIPSIDFTGLTMNPAGCVGTTAFSGLDADIIMGGAQFALTAYNFENCTTSVHLDMSGCTASLITSLNSSWSGCANLPSIDFTGWGAANLTQLSGTFSGCSSLTTITGIDAFNTTTVTTMANMFNGCAVLTGIDFSGWDVVAVTNMTDIFNGCAAMAQADLDSFLEACYNARAANVGGHTLAFDTWGTQGLSGVYQDDETPSTGLEWAYKLNNDPDTEGFAFWNITDVNIP
jgi:surface protein